MSRMNVLVTCPPMLGMIDEFADAFESYGLEFMPANVTQIMSEDELIEQLHEYDGWIIGDDPATRRVFEAGKAGKLKAAVKWGVGVDNVDFEACKDLGIPVTNLPGVFGREVADVATTFVLGLARQTYFIDRKIRAEKAWPKPAGVSTWNKTAGLVGFGDIGRSIAKRLLACDMRIIAYDPFHSESSGLEVEQAEWPNRIEEADFLVFSAPLNPSTHKMLNAETLSKAKDGVYVVNVGRGPVIDEAALIAGLQSGKVHSAALDVFEVEPLPTESPLREMERCILGSHNGSNTVDAVRRVSHMAIDRMAQFLSQGG